MTPLTILLLEENDNWIAQCLQHDIAAQGNTLQQAIDELTFTIASEIAVCKELGKDINDIPPAPNYYWKLAQYHPNKQ